MNTTRLREHLRKAIPAIVEQHPPRKIQVPVLVDDMHWLSSIGMTPAEFEELSDERQRSLAAEHLSCDELIDFISWRACHNAVVSETATCLIVRPEGTYLV